MGYVYVLECSGGVVKIGQTCNPSRRLYDYKSNKNPADFSIKQGQTYTCLWECDDQACGPIERAAISILKSKALRIRREGFAVEVFEAIDAIHTAAAVCGEALKRTKLTETQDCPEGECLPPDNTTIIVNTNDIANPDCRKFAAKLFSGVDQANILSDLLVKSWSFDGIARSVDRHGENIGETKYITVSSNHYLQNDEFEDAADYAERDFLQSGNAMKCYRTSCAQLIIGITHRGLSDDWERQIKHQTKWCNDRGVKQCSPGDNPYL